VGQAALSSFRKAEVSSARGAEISSVWPAAVRPQGRCGFLIPMCRRARLAAYRHHEAQVGTLRATRVGVGVEGDPAEESDRAARPRQVGHLVRRLAEVARNPDRAQPKAGEHGFEHLVAVDRLHQDAISLDDLELRRERRRDCVDAAVERAPRPLPLPPDESYSVAIAPRRLGDQVAQVHHARAYPAWGGRPAGRHDRPPA
jgi:hypothetical protein